MTEPAENPAPTKSTPSPRILRVSGGTDCHRLAHAILGEAERQGVVIIEYIAAGPCNQAVKAIAIANGTLASQKRMLAFVPYFQRRQLRGNDNAVAMQLHGRLYPLT